MQSIPGGGVRIQQIRHAYNPNGTLASIVYPGRGALSHTDGATARLTGLSWNGTPLLSAITWN